MLHCRPLVLHNHFSASFVLKRTLPCNSASLSNPIFLSNALWDSQRMRLGTCVTNPATRDLTVTASLFATLNLISGGRMELGIGRGDSSRRVLGKKPVSWSQLEAAVKELRDLMAGNEVEHDGQPARLTWAKESPRIWIAGYGPKVLHMAGRVADGIILQFADP